MTLRLTRERANVNRLGLLCAATLAALLLLPSPGGGRGSASPAVENTAAAAAVAGAPAATVQIPPRPWTALGSTGAVDESSMNLFATVSTEMGFRPGVAGNTLVARYNVTNTFDNNANPNVPGWTRLEMGSNAPMNVIISAKLFKVSACTAAQSLVCEARNRSNDFPCARCTFAAPSVDFTNNLYYVEVTFDRTGAPAALPRMFTLRLL